MGLRYSPQIYPREEGGFPVEIIDDEPITVINARRAETREEMAIALQNAARFVARQATRQVASGNGLIKTLNLRG